MTTTTRRSFCTHTAAAATLAALSPGTLLAADTRSLIPARRIAPRPSPLGAVTLDPASDLAQRTQQNFTRLQDPIYRPPLVFRQTNWKSWPGDFEGRALLADTLLARSTGHAPEYLATMPAAYRAQLNDKGYFGPLLDRTSINEQQLSGHGWYLRALCESYAWTHDPATLAQISLIVHNLALPLRGAYATYPIDPAMRARATAPANPGAVDGHLDAQHGDWAVSSDTGCAFIFLDGLTQAWTTLRSAGDPAAAPLKELIDEAIARFTQIDLVAIKAQTHATLTALRALLRVYESATPDQTDAVAFLRTVEDRYKLYRSTAMTEHYANTNWFGRPDSWTEPCAIIDSFMVATDLWRHTGDPAYLEDAHRIWFNGIGRGLRANGGFGTDTCPGRTPFVRVRSYEAYFCCTMRGGEGHARAAEYLYFTQPGGIDIHSGSPLKTRPCEVCIPFYENSTFSFDPFSPVPMTPSRVTIRQTTQYPYNGRVRLEFLNGSPLPITLRLFAPSWTSAHRVTLNNKPLAHTTENGFVTVSFPAKAGDVVTLDQTLRVGARDPISAQTPAGSYAFEAGPLLLGYTPPADPSATLRSPDPAEIRIPRTAELTPAATPGAYRVAGTDITLNRINDLNELPGPTTAPHPRQVLFRS